MALGNGTGQEDSKSCFCFLTSTGNIGAFASKEQWGERKQNLTKSSLLAYKKLLYLAKLDILLAFIYEPKHPEGDYLPTLISNKKLTSARGARTGVHGPNPVLKLHQFKSRFFLPSEKSLCASLKPRWRQETRAVTDALWTCHLTRFKKGCCQEIFMCLRQECLGISDCFRWFYLFVLIYLANTPFLECSLKFKQHIRIYLVASKESEKITKLQ